MLSLKNGAAVVFFLLASCASAQPSTNNPSMHHHGQHDHGHHGQGFHRRFDDAARWSAVFDDPARDQWQRPDEVLRWLALPPTALVADLGAGTGYFSVRLARALPQGRVWAEDIESTLVTHMQERAQREGHNNLFAVLGTTEDPLLPERVDVILVVDTYHHISNRPAFFRHLRGRLRPGGRIVIIDFRENASMGPPREHRLSPATVTQEFTEAGYTAVSSFDSLPEQYVLSFTPMRTER